MITPTMGFVLLLMMLLIAGGAFFACLFVDGGGQHNPNAKHYCIFCRELEWDCDCPEC